jgi:transaldolase
MKFFIDSADLEQIHSAAETGMADGVTTNPSLIAKEKADFKTRIKEICAIISGPVSAEVAAIEYADMMREAEILAGLASNVVIKLPLTVDGLKACKTLTAQGVKTNVTLCFSPLQALLAAKAGATYISPFIGRLDDIHLDGCELIRDIRLIYNHYQFTTEILAASVRNVSHVAQSARAGADVATIPLKILQELYVHPLTDKGLQQFLSDWKASGGTIL